MRNYEKVIGALVFGGAVIIGYELVKTGIQVIKNKNVLKGIKEQLNDLDVLIDQAEELNDYEEIH